MTVTPTMRVAAYGLITREREILLCRLSAIVTGWEGQWTLPGGGLDWGEHPEACVVREVHEETGLHVSCGALAGVNSWATDDPAIMRHSLRILYHATVIGGELRHELNGSTDRCEWIPLDALADLPTVPLVDYAISFLG